MKKQLLIRNRRSASSCSTYSHQSSSTILQSQDSQLSVLTCLKQKQKDKQIKSPMNSANCSNVQLDYQQIQKMHLMPVYNQIRNFLIAAESNAKLPDKNIVVKWKQGIKEAIKMFRELYKHMNSSLTQIKQAIAEIDKSKNNQINQIKAIHQQELKILQNDLSKRIIDINAQFSQKQQQYKQTLSKFIQSLHKSQKCWSRLQSQLSVKIKQTEQLLKTRIDIDSKNQQVYQQISVLNNQLLLPPTSNYNSSNTYNNNNNNNNIITNTNNNNEDSLGSINLSSDQVIIQHVQLQKMQSRRNTIDISSIDQIDEHDNDNDQDDVENWQFYKCLEKMVSWGFFTMSNFSNIKKLVDISKNMDNPEIITKQPIFPIIVQAMKLQLSINNEISELDSQDNSLQCDQKQIRREPSHQYQRAALKEIKNQKC